MKKTHFYAVACMVVAALAFVGCKPQSELNFDDIATKAVVQGYVYIDKGYVQDANGMAKLNEPAKGVAVVVKVNYDEYDKGAEGQKMFEGICDDNGLYTIEIPVGQKAISGMKAYTRPFVGEYFDFVNGAIQKVEVSYAEQSTSVDIENGKTFMAANMTLTKDVEKPILARNQKVSLRGTIVEQYEKKEWIDPDDHDKGFNVVAATTNATKPVEVVATFTNTDPKFKGQELVFKATAATEGAYNLVADLYDTWDISKTEVKIETKAYLNTIIHYFKKYSEDDKKYLDKTEEIEGYYAKAADTKALSDGDLLIGCTMPNLPVEFTPDYAKMEIHGIPGGPDEDVYVKGYLLYIATNPLGWAY